MVKAVTVVEIEGRLVTMATVDVMVVVLVLVLVAVVSWSAWAKDRWSRAMHAVISAVLMVSVARVVRWLEVVVESIAPTRSSCSSVVLLMDGMCFLGVRATTTTFD